MTVDPAYAWDHGDYAAEINTNYIGFAGPGVRHPGLDGSGPAEGPSSAGADSGQTGVIDTNLQGPWTDETDIQPTLMYLAGLHTDYVQDGRVITQILRTRTRRCATRSSPSSARCTDRPGRAPDRRGGGPGC